MTRLTFILILSFAMCTWTLGQTTYGSNNVKWPNDTAKARAFFFSPKPKHIDYPKAALDNNVQGTVVLVFDIDSTCAIINRRVEKGLGYGCDESALKVIDDYQADLKKENKSKCPNVKDFRTPLKFKIN